MSSPCVYDFSHEQKQQKVLGGRHEKGVNRGMKSAEKKILHSKYLHLLAFNENRLHNIIADNEVSVGGYDIVRCDRPLNGRNGGGVCLYILSNINHDIRKDLDIWSTGKPFYRN